MAGALEAYRPPETHLAVRLSAGNLVAGGKIMILEGGENGTDGHRVTLDHLFRRAGVRHPEALALADPPNRETFTAGPPRRLSYIEADRAISAFAARLMGLGLPTDTVVGVQLPNTIECVIALLGILRAGMIAAPLPALWHRREIATALGRAGAKALVTASRVGAHGHADIAMQAAAELFPIRYVCGFGESLPDGMVPLDDVFVAGPGGAVVPPIRTGHAAAHVATVTFDVTRDGVAPIMRSHNALIAAGEAVVREAGMAAGTAIISSIPLSSIAGIAVTLLPWLEAGGTLHLHHGFDVETFSAQRGSLGAAAVVLPGPVVGPLHEAGLLRASVGTIALWRSPERRTTAPAWTGDGVLVDVLAGDEASLAAARRDGRANIILTSGAPGGVARVGGYRFGLAELETLVAAADPGAVIVSVPDALTGERLAGSSADPEALRQALEENGVSRLISGAFRRRNDMAA
jgi:hypothetical protein